MENLNLFDEIDPRFSFREDLAARLARLAQQGVFIGTSSWKYEGWLGTIYTPERYFARGKFSQKKFNDDCLTEYTRVFPCVGGDFSYYQFPSAAFWQKLFASVPPTFRFGLKVPEDLTVKTFPSHARYGARSGQPNDYFLDADLLQRAFLDLLKPYQQQVGVLMFEFSAFPRNAFDNAFQFYEKLDAVLRALPKDFRYAVEIRNPELLEPDYFTLLREHETAHVFNAWTRMPELTQQMSLPEAFTTDFTVVRALLKRGRAYEDAVQQFSPYEKLQDENPEGRTALRGLIGRSLKTRQTSYIFVNNRFEGNAPGTIEAITAE